MNYLPYFEANDCITLDNLNNGYIRVYDSVPTYNSTINYTDYFPNYNYLSRSGQATFGNYFNSVNCVSHDNFTTENQYRIDYPYILLEFFIIAIFAVYLPIKIFSKLIIRGSL